MELSARLKTLTIIQKFTGYKQNVSDYLFGLRNNDWVKLIGEMFENKLNCLTIENEHYSHIQNTEQLLKLLEVTFIKI